MVEKLFLRGAGWNLLNANDETPACVLQRRGLTRTKLWDAMVDAGVRAEILLRKLNDPNIEFLDSDGLESEPESEPEAEDDVEIEVEEVKVDDSQEPELENTAQPNSNLIEEDPSSMPEVYLKTKLEYKDGALVTDRGDGVMMDWENGLMAAGCDSLFKGSNPSKTVLNIGFGMGIIDTMIQERSPANHYICEAHPDVLAKLKQDGWYSKPGVHILEGRWQDTLPELLSKNVFFDGIYYDTYSEHYEDMLELFDLVVGLLTEDGVFSFFNGLGADRLVVYEVYRKLVEIDLANYGLELTYTEINAPTGTLEEKDETDETVWNGIKRAYWRCPVYYHPEARFK
ncbi:unnamed protein product [Kuraishia capsulata CBS 1993]|uniref:Arginine N-methyltransferase 2 n=1 Tax=Kuraishia capsulata CBS 1993 TaxID=1382522 RepID=W6MFD7_9ASCO|nr:uncharacterized protein KUCA_T00000216001 [Kuraishia capsulata CBS 1993]CDK24256.1 unnamed protein product [Kuraishia capsulata CBS 1993]